MALLRTFVGIAVAGAALALAPLACRSNKAGGEGAASSAASAAASAAEAPSAAPAADSAGEGGSSGEALAPASNRFGDAGPKAALDPDGPIDPACVGDNGAEVSFASAVVDERCAIGASRARQLRAVLERDGGPLVSLRQDARVLGDGRIAVRLINAGSAALMLPLSFSAKLPAFTVLAEDDRKALYELESPRFEVGPGVGPGAGRDADDRPHFARIVLAPGGVAVATITVQPGVARVIGRRGGAAGDAGGAAGDAGGDAAPSRLAKGRYVLHVGELLADVEAGAPARVTWDLP